MASGGAVTGADIEMFTPAERAVIHRWQQQMFTSADLAVISRWQANRARDAEEQCDAEELEFLRKTEMRVEAAGGGASSLDPDATLLDGFTSTPGPSNGRLRKYPGDAFCCEGCLVCALAIVLRHLCPVIFPDVAGLWFAVRRHAISYYERADAEIEEIIRETDRRRRAARFAGARSPGPGAPRVTGSSSAPCESDARVREQAGRVCRRATCYACAAAVMLRHTFLGIFYDLPLNACAVYETWIYEHEHRFFSRPQRTPPDQPAGKRRRLADIVNPQ